MVAFLGSIKDDPAWDDDLFVTTFTMFTDEEEFNVWRNYETGEEPEDPLDWSFGEPNGGMVENCAQIWVNPDPDDSGNWVGSFNDGTCFYPVAVACEGVEKVVLTFRGEIKKSFYSILLYIY